MSCSNDCNVCGDDAKTTWSSAYRIKNSFSSLTEKILLKSEFILSTISFTNNMNSKGELGSPCFRPILD